MKPDEDAEETTWLNEGEATVSGVWKKKCEQKSNYKWHCYITLIEYTVYGCTQFMQTCQKWVWSDTVTLNTGNATLNVGHQWHHTDCRYRSKKKKVLIYVKEPLCVALTKAAPLRNSVGLKRKHQKDLDSPSLIFNLIKWKESITET